MPTSGCNKSRMRNTNNKKSEKTQERLFLSLTQIDNNQALSSANEGFINSDGCIENPKNLIHLVAPFVSMPKKFK